MRRAFSPQMFADEEDVATLDAIFLEAGAPTVARGRETRLVDHLALVAREFSGQSLLTFRAAWLIVSIRRGVDQEAALGAFFALWDEGGDRLCRDLDLRWLVSCADTFAQHGRTEAERALGQSASMLANTAKLYESERRAAGAEGLPGDIDAATRLFDGMTAYSFGRGDVIRNMVARLDALDGATPAERLQREIVRRLFAADTVLRRAMDVHHRTSTLPWPPVRRVAVLGAGAPDADIGALGAREVLDDALAREGARVVYREQPGADWRRSPRAQLALRTADLILVDAGGVTDPSDPEMRRRVGAGRSPRRRGARCAVINVALTDADDALLADLAQFDAIFARDGAAAGFLRGKGLNARLAPDPLVCLPERPPAEGGGRSGHLIFDSADAATTVQLAALAARAGRPLLTTERDPRARALRAVPQARLADVARHGGRIAPLLAEGPSCDGVADLRAMVAAAEGVTSGRFHPACYAVLERTPFVALAEGAPEIRTLIADIGLDAARVLRAGDALRSPWPFSPAELEAIDVFLWRARSRFDRLRQVLFRPI